MKKAWFLALVVLLVLVLLIIIAGGFYFALRPAQKANVNALSRPLTVVLDCGHGGPDGGAVGEDGTLEKDINLALGFQLAEILKQNGFRVVMTRQKDAFICDDTGASLREQNVSDLHNRLKIAESEQNSIFISLHMNKYSQSKYWGSQLFFSPNHPDSKLLAGSIRKHLLATVQKGNTRPLKEMDSSVYIIYRATHPALLLECGFMSNPEELNRFKDKNYRSAFAFAVFLGIIDYINGANIQQN